MKIKSFLLAICLMASTGLFAQTYVHEGEDLQAAVNAAEPGTTVYVQAGTFYGNFQMKEGVNVSGGWNADFTAQTDYISLASLLLAGSQSAPGDIGFSSDPAVPIQGGD